jgi:hypothetical protein
MLKLNDQSRKFKDFIGYSTQTEANKALSKMLFSENTLEMDIEYGFRGNPNIGSVVLNQLNDQDVFKSFASDLRKMIKFLYFFHFRWNRSKWFSFAAKNATNSKP